MRSCYASKEYGYSERMPMDAVLVKNEKDWSFYFSESSKELIVNLASYHPGMLFMNKDDLVELLKILVKVVPRNIKYLEAKSPFLQADRENLVRELAKEQEILKHKVGEDAVIINRNALEGLVMRCSCGEVTRASHDVNVKCGKCGKRYDITVLCMLEESK